MEACATAHYWAREIGKLGHEVRLIPPAYVKPFVNGPAGVRKLLDLFREVTMRIERSHLALSDA